MIETFDKVGSTLAGLRLTLAEAAIRYGLQVLGALVILLAGLWIAAWAARLADVWLTRRALDVSLRALVVRVLRILLTGAAIAVAAEKAGIPVTSLVAGIGIAGLGVGFALQGVLGNVFAGLTILFTRPFRVGEYIDVLGVHGRVVEITVFTTTLQHADTSRVVVPNRKIVGEILHNYGTTRQLDLRLGVAYATDLERALAVVRETVLAHPAVLKDPAPLVGVRDLGESVMVIAVRPWVAVPDVEPARLDLNRALVEACRRHQVELPPPQREVRLLGTSTPEPRGPTPPA
jgi:small conductance mechanosensitive channel